MKKKRIMALFLCVALLLCGLPMASAATQPYVESDTTADFTKPQGDYYWFKFTVHGTHEDPKIAAGNGSILKTGNCKKMKNVNGEDEYRFQVFAVGKPGEASAIYTTLPGQNPVKHCVITIGQPQPKKITTANKMNKPSIVYVEPANSGTELWERLSKFNTLETNLGTLNFNIVIRENSSKYYAYDYSIKFECSLSDLQGPIDNIKYTDEQRATYYKKLKEHMELIATTAEAAAPGKKLIGEYYNYYYEYPALQLDLVEHQLFGFANFVNRGGYDAEWKQYDESPISELHWIIARDNIDVNYEGIQNYSALRGMREGYWW
ncbi:hypothetical protein [Anaeromassilibacillus senegalensis]|uniref:hypothetical protein n=1 Tax=Anaeromassilibacillus senegalensis TaxID=1673717 RepID=UPI00067FF87B|nr:hypothetical protein [Anaeromassilibacillus senegalensis]